MKKILVPSIMFGLFGCISLSQLLSLNGLFTLSAIPDSNFSNEDSKDYGLVKIKVGAIDKLGVPLSGVLDRLEITSGLSVVDIESSSFVEGHTQGDLLVLVDGSGSLEGIGCASCPTDPMRHRVDAVIELAHSLHECSADWNIGLMEFGPRNTDGFAVSAMIVDYTIDTSMIENSAGELTSDGGTPLWDAMLETMEDLSQRVEQDLNDLDDEPSQGFLDQEPIDDFGRGLVVITDGEDTVSSSNVGSVISLAKELEIPVSVIALGEASDLVFTSSESAVTDLRRVADETGGFYATVSMAMDLPILSDYVAKAYCGGHTELLARFTDVPHRGEQVDGRIWLKSTGISTPFGFRAP